MSADEKDIEMEAVVAVADTLSAHFDSLVIIATKHEGSDTKSWRVTRGNLFASRQAAADFVDMEKESALLEDDDDPRP